MLEACALFFVSLLGGCLPVLMRWSHRQLHTALALSTGIFLGAVFLHLLPELSEIGPPDEVEQVQDLDPGHAEPGHVHDPAEEHAEEEHASEAKGGHDHDHVNTTIWLFVLIGVLGVYLVEALVLPAHGHDDVRGHDHEHADAQQHDPDHEEIHRHQAVGYASLFGLSVHALTAGIALGTSYSMQMLVAMLAHKGFETFSLASVFQLAERKRSRVLLMVLCFSLITPIGMFVGDGLQDILGTYGEGILQALAAGTFLFVCLSELLPEVFHHREDTVKRLVLIAVGILVIYLCGRYEG